MLDTTPVAAAITQLIAAAVPEGESPREGGARVS
jgi:hypothetical protein